MSYCTKHIIKIIKPDGEPTLSDYAVFQECLGKIDNYFPSDNMSFIIRDGYLIDCNWNYGFGCDWCGFEKDMLEVSKLMPDVSIKCAFIGEETWAYPDKEKDGDAKFLHYKNGEVIENKRFEMKYLEWFKSIYCKR